MGDANYKAGDFNQAIKSFVRGIKLEGAGDLKLTKLGLAYQAAGDHKEAISVYKRVWKWNLTFPFTWEWRTVWATIRLASIYAANLDYEDVAVICGKIIQNYPAAWWAWRYLCESYIIMRQPEGIREVYERTTDRASGILEKIKIAELPEEIESRVLVCILSI